MVSIINKKRTSFSCNAITIGIVLAGFQLSLPGFALAADEEKEKIKGIEVITVTAQKREESSRDVPIAITAMSGDTLRELGATDFDDMLDFVPGVHFAKRGTPGENSFVIRGMGIPVNGSASTSAIYIDEIPVTSAKRIPEIRTFDVERIEVLRGPQGTVYGEGAMGGAIKVVSEQPVFDEFVGAVGATVENTDEGGTGYIANAMVNVPLSDSAALRFVGFSSQLDGYIDDISGENNHNDSDMVGGRAALKVAITDDIDFLATYHYEKQEIGGFGKHDPAGAGDLKVDNVGVNEFRENQFDAWSAVINWDLGFATLTSATSSYDYDGDGTSYAFLEWNFDPAHEGFFQEIRLASNKSENSNLDWLAGVFYKDSEFSEDFPDFAFKVSGKTEQKAVFAEVTYHFSEQWAGIVGARYANEDVEGTFVNVRTESTSDNALTTKFVLNYTPNDDSLYYLSAAQGFRSSGVAVFAASLPAPLNEITQFDHDSLWNYELGAKVASPDNDWLVEGAVFYTDWQDTQVSLDPAGPGFTIINSTDGAHVMGVEAALTWMTPMIEGLQISINGSRIEAEFDGDDPSGVGNFSKGDRMNDVPEWTASAIVQYNFSLTDSLEAYARFEASGRSDYIHVTRQEIASMNTQNLRFGIESDYDWEASIWVENLSNKRGINALDNDMSTFPIPAKPRTVGVSFRTNF